mmetsp:Transcript_5413/g.8547  ORF Transcript_5413/g.8547 Transcript_5413/m.8547 type:complete len:81 (+) Transcript_5413:638-880(+)
MQHVAPNNENKKSRKWAGSFQPRSTSANPSRNKTQNPQTFRTHRMQLRRTRIPIPIVPMVGPRVVRRKRSKKQPVNDVPG